MRHKRNASRRGEHKHEVSIRLNLLLTRALDLRGKRKRRRTAQARSEGAQLGTAVNQPTEFAARGWLETSAQVRMSAPNNQTNQAAHAWPQAHLARAALPLQMRPHAGEARQLVLRLRQLHLRCRVS